MRQGKRAAGALLAATALGATAACGVFGGESEEADDETRLVEMLNESYRLDAELTAAEYRIVQQCLADQGHTVHDQWEMQTWEPEEQESLTMYYPYEEFLPEPDMAAKWGFGQWSNAEEAWESDEAEEYQEERWGDEEGMNQPDVDNSEFEALSPEEQFDWYTAYYGEAYAQEYYSWALDPEGEEGDEGELTDEELAENAEEGEIDLESESYDEPKPGGCKLEMIEALYGEPRQVTDDEVEGETYSYWEWRPAYPESEQDWEEMTLNYRAAVQDQEYDFLDCIAEAGYGGWEFDEYGGLPIWQFFEPVYFEEDGASGVARSGAGDEPEVPEAPSDLPSDFEGKKAWEIEMAVAFVECGESTGYGEAAKQAWEEAELEHYLAIEEEMFAYQEDLKASLEKAQDMIDS
ncbi:hypothetical protein [Glycomyces tarimensis]